MGQTFDVEGARKAGYSDQEIALHLGKEHGFDADAALKAGYKPAELIDHMKTRGDRGGFNGFVSSVGEYAKTALKGMNVVEGAADTLRSLYINPESGQLDLSQAGKTIDAHTKKNAEAATEAVKSFKSGDYATAARHAFNYLVPFGTSFEGMSNDAADGHMARALGNATAFGVTTALAPKITPAAGAAADATSAAASRVANTARAVTSNIPAADLVALGADAVGSFVPQAAHAISFGKGVVKIGKTLYRLSEQGAPTAAPVKAAPRAPRSAPATAAPPQAIPTAIELAPGYATRPDVIPSEYGVLPAIDRSQYFRPLSNERAPVASAPAVVEPAIAQPVVEAPVPEPVAAPAAAAPKSLAEKSKAAFDEARARRIEDAADAQRAHMQMDGENIEWSNRAKKADRFANYLTENKIEPTAENIATATRHLGYDDVPSPTTVELIHERMKYEAPAEAPSSLEQQLMDSLAAQRIRGLAEARGAEAPAPKPAPSEMTMGTAIRKGRAAKK